MVNYLNATDQLLPRKTVQTTEKVTKKKHCNWMALFELNMELETCIAVDGHDFPNVSRFTCGGVSNLRISTAVHSNPRHPRVAWSKAAVRRGTKFRHIFGHHYR